MLKRAASQEGLQYHPNCEKVKLTHLSFADDLLIFIDGSLNSVQHVLKILHDFELRSGLKVSMQNTSFYASGLSAAEVDTIQASTGMVCGALPIRYLGVPLNSKNLNLVNCEPLLHQIKKRLSSWTVKSLSFAGRLLLIKTVISSIITFWCSAFILPKACIRRINSLCSVFLWKGDIESKNSARVAWEKCVLTKEQGGLGIKDLQTWNIACCIKLIWLLFFKAGSVWVAWFTEKVLKRSIHNYWTTKPSPSYSCLAVTLNNSVLRLGIPDKATVASLFRRGAWRLPPARSEPQLLLHTFLTTITLSQNPDYYEWEIAGKVGFKYSTGEVYTYLRGEIPDVPWAPVVWFSFGIPRQQFHTWLVLLDRCPTKDRLLNWGLQVSPLCLLCNNDDETRDHIFSHCSYSSEKVLSPNTKELEPDSAADASITNSEINEVVPSSHSPHLAIHPLLDLERT
ncbi:hypothetical protein Bca4012_063773 [Brassica carinata]